LKEEMMTAPTSINVTQLIDDRPFGSLQTRVFVLCTLAIILDGMDSLAIGLAATSIAQALKFKMSAFGLVFGMGQAGVMFGALAFGPLADRVGRKAMLISAVLLFAVFTFLTAQSNSYSTLLLFRFLTGAGLGGATPNAIALTAEYTPQRSRAALVSALWAGFPLGGILAGLVSSYLLPHYGWRYLFYVGGVAPLVLCVVFLFVLPESPGFLVARNFHPRKIHSVIQELAPDLHLGQATQFSAGEMKMPGMPFKYLFTQRRAATTLLLWVAFFCTFLVLIFVSSWIPALLRTVGLPVTLIGVSIALNSLGSMVGSGIVGRAMDRLGTYRVLTVTFILGAIVTAIFGFTTRNFQEIAIVILLQGCFAGASQSGVIAFAAKTYPIAIRSTGVGWAIALGRFGAVVAPLLGGMLMAWGWRMQGILIVIALPLVFGLIALQFLRWATSLMAGVEGYGGAQPARAATGSVHGS
jgi:AAHS family 4-hydroxybenzoate transporter-like MFS transporter